MNIKLSNLVNPELNNLAAEIKAFRDTNTCGIFHAFGATIILEKDLYNKANVLVNTVKAPTIDMTVPSVAAVNLFIWMLRKDLI